MTTAEIVVAALTCVNVLFVLLAWRRTGKRDTRDETASDEQTRADLRYVMRGVDEIRVDIRAMRGEINVMDRRLTVVEESTKSAHKRIDEHLKMHPADGVRND